MPVCGTGGVVVQFGACPHIPLVRAKTTEHQLLTLRCGCGRETNAAAPDGVTAPVQYGPPLMGTRIYLWHGQFLSRDRDRFQRRPPWHLRTRRPHPRLPRPAVDPRNRTIQHGTKAPARPSQNRSPPIQLPAAEG
jgi:hypothetical protein